jgi:hypothetical protein
MTPTPSDYEQMLKFSHWAASQIPDHESAALDCRLLDTLVKIRKDKPDAEDKYVWCAWINDLLNFKRRLSRATQVAPAALADERAQIRTEVQDVLLLLTDTELAVVSTHFLCRCTMRETASVLHMTPARAWGILRKVRRREHPAV